MDFIDSVLTAPSLILFFAGLIAGLVFGFNLAKSKKTQNSLSKNSQVADLQNEVLQDQVKQLEAKIRTLEKALEMTS